MGIRATSISAALHVAVCSNHVVVRTYAEHLKTISRNKAIVVPTNAAFLAFISDVGIPAKTGSFNSKQWRLSRGLRLKLMEVLEKSVFNRDVFRQYVKVTLDRGL